MAASKIVDELRAQFKDQLGDGANKFLKTGLPLAPLLFLQPAKKRDGIEGLAFDPRVWGPVLAAGVALFKEFGPSKDSEPATLKVFPSELELATNKAETLKVFLKDKNGKIVEGDIEFLSAQDKVATVSPSGEVKGVKAGKVAILVSDSKSGLDAEVAVTVK